MNPLVRNKRITIERPETTTDNYGDEVEGWVNYADTFAQVRFGSSQERREAAQETAIQTATFVVLHSETMAAVGPDYRIIWQGQWDISGPPVPSLELNDHLEITAVRRSS